MTALLSGRLTTVGSRTTRTRALRAAYASIAAVAVITLVALLAGLLSPYNPVELTGPIALPPLSPDHLLGTDAVGRDLLSRLLYGLQVSWFSSLLVVACGLLVGGTIGIVAAATGGVVDSFLMRTTDLFLALPGTLVAIAIVAALGNSLSHTLIAIMVVWWPYYARIIRAEAKQVAALPHVEAARISGASRLRVMSVHIAPGVFKTALITASLDVGNVIVLLAGLSFIGIGQPAPAPELGADTAQSMSMLLTQWWVPVIPGMTAALLSLAANLAGDGTRTLLDERDAA